MNITLPVIPNFTRKYISVQVGKKKVKVYHSKHKIHTIYSLLKKLAKGKRVIDGRIIYKINAAISEQIDKTITKVAHATKYSEIVPLWFRYDLIHLSTVAMKRSGVYDCQVKFIPFDFGLNAFMDRVIQQFYIGIETFKAGCSGRPFSSLSTSKECAKYANNERLKKVYLFNAFQFYLWRFPSAIDDIPDFDLPISCYHRAESDISIIKELLKARRPDLLSVLYLTVPRIFTQILKKGIYE